MKVKKKKCATNSALGSKVIEKTFEPAEAVGS